MDSESPLRILAEETEQINPAILLAEALMRRDAADLLSAEDIELAETTLRIGRMEVEMSERQLSAFVRSPGNPSPTIPTGF